MPGNPNINEGFIRSHELIEELLNDIDLPYESLESERNSQYLRRSVGRTVFSFIEAAIETIKIELRSTIRTEQYKGHITEKDIEVLGSISFITMKQDKFLPLCVNVKKTFKLAVKIWSLEDFKLSTDNQNFQDFLTAKSSRNRLTHPKTYYDIEVTDSDMFCYTVAFNWIKIEFTRLFKARVDSLKII